MYVRVHFQQIWSAFKAWAKFGHWGWYRRRQGCQILLGAWYQKRKKCTKRPQTIPNGRKLYQMAVKYINIYQSKALQNLPIFLGFENKPSGNPGRRQSRTQTKLWTNFGKLDPLNDNFSFDAPALSLISIFGVLQFLHWMSAVARVTGWVCEKIAENVAQPIYVKN
jgi:hypothetical protein